VAPVGANRYGERNIVSERAVEAKLPSNGLIKANRVEAMENGALILFGGGAETRINRTACSRLCRKHRRGWR
jgi:hypothetical protein